MTKIKFEYRLTLLYLLLGFIWIILTDFFLSTIIDNSREITELQTYKGWFFVLFTAILLFFYTRQHLTKIRNAEKRLELSEEKFRTFVENANDIIYHLNPEGVFIYVSPNWTEILGYRLDEVIGENIEIFVHPNELQLYIDFLNKTISTGVKQSGVEYRIKHKDGTWRWHSSNGSPIKDEHNKTESIIGISRDITETKIKENELEIAKVNAEKANQLKSEFLNNMSHEIRTPMNGIIGFSEMLDKPGLNEETRKYYSKIIQDSSHKLLKIIDDILDISTLKSSLENLNETKFCLNDLLRDLYSINKFKSKEKNVPIHLKKALDDNQSYIISDNIKLNKILSNLLENALKFTNEGFIEFGYLIDKTSLILYVKDTGIGILQENQPLVFERFVHESKEVASKYGGLGLGLSIAKENAKLLGGSITLESEKGKGSTFYVTIPYKPVQFENEEASMSSSSIKSIKDKHTILVAEDEEVNYLYIEALFEDETNGNFNLIHVKNGKEAIDACSNNKNIELVLMDVKMPIMNGLEATEKIKAKFPHIPVIAQTAYSKESEIKLALKYGCDDFISKPIVKEKLFELINKHLNIK